MSERRRPAFLGARHIDSIEDALEALWRSSSDDSDVASRLVIPASVVLRN